MNSKNLRVVLMTLTAFLFTACASDGPNGADSNPLRPTKTERELRLEADELYRVARRKLDSADYTGAILDYSALQSRYPFSEYATQAQLERIYAAQRNYATEQALSDAERFLREHPRHPNIDYILYLKGVISFGVGDGLFDKLPGVDSSRRDVSDARNAFDDFSLLVQRYPDSKYAADARQRMVYLRNRIAEHELHAVRFYVKRGAYVAAARRAEAIISNYPGAPATYEALSLLQRAYAEAGLTPQVQEVKKIRQANAGAVSEFEAALLEAESKPGFFNRVGQRFLGFFGGRVKGDSYEELPPAPPALPPEANT